MTIVLCSTCNAEAHLCRECGSLMRHGDALLCLNCGHNEPAPEQGGSCADCGAPMNAGEAATFTVCDSCWCKAHPKPGPALGGDLDGYQLLDLAARVTAPNCPNCGRPVATAEDWAREHGNCSGCDWCVALCWGPHANCRPDDWRERAEVAARERDDARAQLAESEQRGMDEHDGCRLALKNSIDEENELRARLAAAERRAADERDALKARAEAAWRGLQNIASMLGVECEQQVALGVATSAAGKVLARAEAAERERAHWKEEARMQRELWGALVQKAERAEVAERELHEALGREVIDGARLLEVAADHQLDALETWRGTAYWRCQCGSRQTLVSGDGADARDLHRAHVLAAYRDRERARLGDGGTK